MWTALTRRFWRDGCGATMTGEPSGAAGQADPEDRPGDPACWLRRVCPACGGVADADPPTVCPQCHADMPGV